MASFRNGEDFSNFPIYTSLIEYHPVDIYFLFDESDWIPVQLTKKEEQYGERVTIYDGTYYHHGDIVTDKIVSYTGRKRTVTIPEITLELFPQTEIKTQIVSVRELVKNVDKEYKVVLQKHNFEEIGDRTGYVTNQIIYDSGTISLKYIF